MQASDLSSGFRAATAMISRGVSQEARQKAMIILALYQGLMADLVHGSRSPMSGMRG